jgi:hypothetical protein
LAPLTPNQATAALLKFNPAYVKLEAADKKTKRNRGEAAGPAPR